MIPRIGAFGRQMPRDSFRSPHLHSHLVVRSIWTSAGLWDGTGREKSPRRLQMQISSAVLPHGQSSKMHSARMYLTAATPRNDACATGSSDVAVPTHMEDSPSHAQHLEAAAPVALGNAVEASPDAGDSGEIDAILCILHRHLEGSRTTAISHDNSEGGPAGIADLYEQMRARAGTVLDEELPYEATPSPDRRLRTRAGAVNASEVDRDEQRGAGRRSWLDSCKLAGRRIAPPESVASHSLESSTSAEIAIEEDGLVLVAHVIDLEPPATSWSLGFVVETTSGTKHVVSCSHTLESVSVQITPTSCNYLADGRQHSGSTHATIASITRHKSVSLVIDTNCQPV